MSRRVTFDVVVIGGGISGVMSAYYLAMAGRHVLLVERGAIAGEASGRNGGHVHPSTYDPAQRPLGLSALDLWPALVERLELLTEYRQQGAVSAALPGEEAILAQANDDDPDEPIQLLSPSEAREIVPFLSPQIIGAVFNPKVGNVNPILATRAFATAARRLGVEIWEGVAVTGISVERDAIVGVHTNRGFVVTETVVNCAGAWASTIGDMVGLPVPIIPHRLQILVTEEYPVTTGATFGGHNIYARQALSGQIHFGLLSGPAFDPPLDRFNRVVTAPTFLNTTRSMAELAPGLSDVPILRSWAGVNSITPDGSPIIDAPPQLRGFVIAAGFWNGFGVGVATGKVVSELIVDGHASVDISGLALGRFDDYPTEVLYPWDRWRAAHDGAVESRHWPATGIHASAGARSGAS